MTNRYENTMRQLLLRCASVNKRTVVLRFVSPKGKDLGSIAIPRSALPDAEVGSQYRLDEVE